MTWNTRYLLHTGTCQDRTALRRSVPTPTPKSLKKTHTGGCIPQASRSSAKFTCEKKKVVRRSSRVALSLFQADGWVFRSLPARFLGVSSPDCVRWTLDAVRKCSAGQLRSVLVPIHIYMYLLPYIISTYIPFHPMMCMCASLSCPSSSGSQADRQTDRTDRQTAQLSPPRCGHQQRMRMARPSSLPFPSFPFPSLPSTSWT